jgi:hypothetical protein
LLQSSAPETAARSQWPRAGHSGLMHCTVHPGKYCTLVPPELTAAFSGAWFRSDPEKSRGFCAGALVVSRKKIQFLVVELQNAPGGQPPSGPRGAPRPLQPIRACPQSVFWVSGGGMLRPRAKAGSGGEESGVRLRTRALPAGCVTLLVVVAANAMRAQQPPSHLAQANSQGPSKAPVALAPPRPIHRFWDRTNGWWFAGVGASRGLDYASTLNLRRRGINEVFLTNSIVDNHPLLAGIEAAATGASIGVSYLFHRTGHHRLERWTSIVHLGVATAGAARNYALKTPHQVP